MSNSYYHESLSFETVASCMALLAVLCVQLLWPLQFVLHRLSLGTDLQVFKLSLLGLHLAWLLLNLSAVAFFIITTFRLCNSPRASACASATPQTSSCLAR